MSSVRIEDVRKYWNANPLSAAAIPHPLGTREYFEYYNRLREANESLGFSYRLHEYTAFAGKKVLDVGSGNGYVLSKYAHEGAEVYGIDLTETAIGLCRKRFDYLGLSGSFMVANAEQLPFADESFHCVCSMGVLHHTPNTAAAVAEIHRVLKPGGRLIVMFYHRDSVLYRFQFPLLSLLTRKSVRQLANEVDGIGNPQGDVYSKSELRQLLRQFRDLDLSVGLLQRWMLLPRFGRLLPERLIQRFAGRWGWFLYAKATKASAS